MLEYDHENKTRVIKDNPTYEKKRISFNKEEVGIRTTAVGTKAERKKNTKK